MNFLRHNNLKVDVFRISGPLYSWHLFEHAFLIPLHLGQEVSTHFYCHLLTACAAGPQSEGGDGVVVLHHVGAIPRRRPGGSQADLRGMTG